MKKIGKYYIVSETEMDTINWWLKLLDRRREQDKKERTEHHEEDIVSDL